MSDYKQHKSTGYPRRNFDRDAHKEYVDYLISWLAELERKTDPAGGPATADQKDLHAFQALEFAGKLVDALAGWAIDHQIGLAINGLQFVPNQPCGTKEHPEYQRNKSSVDDHAHERAGALASAAALTPQIMRNIWVNLLKANPCGVGYDLKDTLWNALTALDYGEVDKIIERPLTMRKRNLTALNMQLRAVAFVEYRVARGNYARGKKKAALDEVASALGVADRTIQSWERRLGKLAIARIKSFAANDQAESAIQARLPKEAIDRIGNWKPAYGDEALQELAKDYKEWLKQHKAESSKRRKAKSLRRPKAP